MVRRMCQGDLSAFSPRVTAPRLHLLSPASLRSSIVPVGASGHETVGKGQRGTQAQTLLLRGMVLVTCPTEGINSNTGGML